MMLFDHLPEFPPALPEDELYTLSWLPEWPTMAEIDVDNHSVIRRLEKRGLAKVERHKTDPAAAWPTWFAGKLPSASLRRVHHKRTGKHP